MDQLNYFLINRVVFFSLFTYLSAKLTYRPSFKYADSNTKPELHIFLVGKGGLQRNIRFISIYLKYNYSLSISQYIYIHIYIYSLF